jgi:hypothetical protein
MLASVLCVNAYFQVRKRLTSSGDYESIVSFRTAADQKARNRRSIFGKGLIGIAVQPMLARLRGCDHRMSAGARVFAGVLIRRAVAAQRDSTRLAGP